MSVNPKKSPLVEIFARNVRRKRIALGLSQEVLAEAAGVHRTYVGMLERAEKNVTIYNIERIAVALDVQPASLLVNDSVTSKWESTFSNALNYHKNFQFFVILIFVVQNSNSRGIKFSWMLLVSNCPSILLGRAIPHLIRFDCGPTAFKYVGVADQLSWEWEAQFEIYAEGRYGGIDFLHSRQVLGASGVAQCKR